jgi:hypothetical protein
MSGLVASDTWTRISEYHKIPSLQNAAVKMYIAGPCLHSLVSYKSDVWLDQMEQNERLSKRIQCRRPILTPWSWAVLEKVPVSQLLKNFPVFYGIWRFITVLTGIHHWSLSWATLNHSIPPKPILQRSISVLSPCNRSTYRFIKHCKIASTEF